LARVVRLLLVFQAFYQVFFLDLRRDVGGVLGHAIGRCGVSGLARGIEPAGFLAVFAHVISLPGFRVGSCRVRHHGTMLGLGHDFSLFPRYRLVGARLVWLRSSGPVMAPRWRALAPVRGAAREPPSRTARTPAW